MIPNLFHLVYFKKSYNVINASGNETAAMKRPVSQGNKMCIFGCHLNCKSTKSSNELLMIAPSPNNSKTIFQSPFKLTGECNLNNYCTNEFGHFLNLTANALIGNPLRLIQFDGLGTTQKHICTNTTTSVGVNCSERYISLTNYGYDGSLCIYDLQKGSTLRELHDHDGSISGVAWHRESPWLLASVGEDCTLRLWDLRSHPAQIEIRRATKPYRHLEFSPDCNYIACAGEFISIYDLCMAQNVVRMLSSSPSTCVRFNPSECLLATADDDRTVRFWDVDTGECVTQTPTFNAKIGQIHFEPHGKYLIALTERQIASIRWEPFELISQFELTHSLHFPFSTSNSSSKINEKTNEQQRLLLLDVNVKNERFNQLVVQQNSDPAKCATVFSVCLSLSKLENCEIVTNSSAEVRGIPVERPLLLSFGNDADNLNKKEKDGIAPEVSPGSLLDSLIIEQEEDVGTSIIETETKKDDFMAQAMTKSLYVPNTRRNASVSQNSGVPSIADETMTSTSHLQRPNRLNIVPHINNLNKTSAGLSCSSNNRQKSTSLIRRGSSLNDVANCASESSSIGTQNQTSNVTQPKTLSLAKTCVHPTNFSSSSTMSSSSSNASSSNVSSSLARNEIQIASKKRSESEVRSLEEFMQVNPKLKAAVNKLTIEFVAFLSGLRSIQLNKAEYIVNAVANFEAIHIFAELLHDYLRQPRDHSLALCATFLPRIEILLKHRNNEYPQMALDFLEMVLTSYGEAIRHGLSSRDFTIGVDVAAEQRFERCTKCKNALLQMRMNSSFCVDRLDRNQRQRFDSLMALVDNL